MENSEHNKRFSFEDLPIYKKAMEISNLADKVVDLIRDKEQELPDDGEGEMIQDYGHYIRLNAMTIPAKIAGAEGGDLYDLSMENAAIIRKAAREIQVDCTGLKLCGFEDEDYLDLLRNEIDEFRPLFAEWVKGFDQWNYIIDRWGLFNPPGINYDDKDPDDDIPFNPDDFFGGDL